MTDNEIMKALECCQGNADCANCPYYENNHHQCGDNFNKDVLDLINRQQAEIEKLNVELFGMRGACNSYKMHYDKAQAEIDMLKQPSVVADMEIPKELIERMKRQKVVAIPYDKEGIRSEAIKEFAERLKDLKHECGCNYRKKPVFAVTEDKIDNLVTEMVGEGL